MSRVEYMSMLERIDGLINQPLLKEVETNITCIIEDLYDEGFKSEDIIEYLQKFIGDKLVNILYNLENK